MKIIHLPSSFFPDHTGGKEQFVDQLIRNLPQYQHLVVIHDGDQRRSYAYRDVKVVVLPVLKTNNYRYSYFSLRFEGLEDFTKLLDDERPDVVHFHDQSAGASLSHLDVVKSKNIRSVLTYHSPGQSSLQRALIRNGKEPCDGHLDLTRCTVCRYTSGGLSASLANVIGRVSVPGFDATGRFMLRKSTKIYLEMWREFYDKVDVIQVHAHWVNDMLISNDVSRSKVRYVEMGGSISLPKKEKQTPREAPLKLVFVGRCTDIKGVHLLIDAVRGLPELNVEVHFFGPGWDDDYGKLLQSKIGGDKRFRKPVLLDPTAVISNLLDMDVAVIPSLWPETGPFTVFDAFAAQLPVIGTRHAGIAERCRDGVDSLLFNWGDTADLAAKITELYNDRSLLTKLRSNIRTNRTFAEFATDVGRLYED
jgi:glycosyltransferase involved in cell wall biosynthesis